MNRNFVATTSKENAQMDSNGMERNRRHCDEALKTKDGEIFQQIMTKKARSSYDAATVSPYKFKVSQHPIILSSVISLASVSEKVL
jgi:uncharacterized membrane protein